jgi:putative nucleotidyltransferase with HDIG domain
LPIIEATDHIIVFRSDECRSSQDTEAAMLVQRSTTDYRPLLADFEKGIPVTIRFSFPSKETLLTINSFVAQLLASRDRIFLLESIITILRESVFNAIKANAKRIYFESAGNNISDPQVYQQMMTEFKSRVIINLSEMEAPMKQSRYIAEFTVLKNSNEDITISVQNNVPLLPEEKTRIEQRVTAAFRYQDFNEVYEEMYDETEGAGLGIILTIMILKNSGIPTNLFKITSDGIVTRNELTIPGELRPQEVHTKIKEQIIRQISMLPTFPGTTLELIHMSEDPSANMNDIAQKINTDPSLAADILKLANSAGFISARKIETIADALIRIGLKNLKFMLIAASSRAILEKRFQKFESIWAHCIKTAYYARLLAIELGFKQNAEQAFIGGLLHDMGKIVLLSVDLDMTNRIAEIIAQHRIRTTTVIEEISIGISHSSIGKLIAEKWNFAGFIVQSIEYHHSPLRATGEYKNIVWTVYLANLLCGIETKKYEYSYADMMIINLLGIKDEASLIALHQKLLSQPQFTEQ